MKKTMDTQKIHLRKTSSVLLIIVMLFGLIPTKLISSAATDVELSGTAITYDFRLNAYSGDADSNGRNYIDYSETRPWAYVSDTFSTANPIMLLTNYMQSTSLLGQRMVLKIKIPATGRYKTSFTYYAYSSGADIDIYLVPKTDASVISPESYMSSENLLGSVDTYQATAETKQVDLSEANVNAGEYLLIFNAARKNANASNCFMVFSSLTLNGHGLGSANITLNKSKLSIGDTTTVIATGKMDDNTVATGVTVSYSSSNPGVATVDPTSGVVTALSKGSTNITAIVTKDDVSKSASVSVNVDQALLAGAASYYNFKNAYYDGETDSNARNYTNYGSTRPWAYISDTLIGTEPATLKYFYLQIVSQIGQQIVFKIKVPKSGRYKSSINYYGYANGGIMNIYLVPLSEYNVAHVSEFLTNDYLLDSVDTYSSTASSRDKSINDAVFESTATNEYLLICRSIGKNASAGGSNMIFTSFTFSGHAVDTAQISLSKNEIYEGFSTNASATGKMTDGTNVTGATITYISSNPYIATVDPSTGVITGVSAGNTNITATLTKDGVSKSSTASLTVKPAVALSGVVNTYDFRLNAYTGDTSTNIRDYASNDNRPWMWVSDNISSVVTNSVTVNYLQLVASLNQRIVFKIKVQNAGRYKSSITYLGYENGGIIDFYLIPYSTEAASQINNYMTSQYKFGTQDTYNSVSGMRDGNLNDVVFDTAGEYLLVLCASGHNTSNNAYNMVFSKITFNGCGLNTADLSLDKSEIELGGSATATTIGKMTDGTNATGVAFAYSSSNPNIATINPSTGVITGVSAGRVKITVNATLNGVTVKSSKIITVGHTNAATQGALRITVANSIGSALSDVAITGEGSTPAFTLNEQGSFDTGTSFIVTAPTVADKTFLYWKNATSKRIVTTSQTCSFKIGSNTYLTAVYKETGSGVMVEFVDRNGRVFQSCLNETTTSVIAPNPFSIGYDFQNWTSGNLNIAGGSDVTSTLVGGNDTRFLANYTKSAAQYTIIVTGSTADGTTTHAYDDLIIVTATPPSGQEFAYWTRNGQITSYSPTYNFYVWDNSTVAAVYVPTGEALPAIPQVMMDTVKTATGRVLFSAERTVPDGYELVESGILITSDGASATNTAFNLQTTGVIKAITQSTQKNGQFTVRRDNVSGTWYARAYIIYKDTATGLCKVVYSNIVNGTSQ